MIGYCVRCKAKQEMVSATRTYMKNGRRSMIGLCGHCGTKMSVAGLWDTDSSTDKAFVSRDQAVAVKVTADRG